MRVMLTGGSGNIGRRVLARLTGEHDVTVVDRTPPPDGAPARLELLDLTSPAQLDRVAGPFDAIVHLAAIPNPYHDPWEEVLRVNLQSTFNVLRYAVERGVPKVIVASSESASGWGIHGRFYKPDYLPIDEAHPCKPAEVYSYTKYFGDLLCEGFSREHDLATIAFRYTFVLFPGLYSSFIERVSAPGPRLEKGGTYCWIDVEDVAEAMALGLAYEMSPGQHEVFYLTARDHFGTGTVREMVELNWGGDVPLDPTYYDDHPRGSLFDIRKAERLLGWRPQWDLARVIEAHR